jgi:hypothetical protein
MPRHESQSWKDSGCVSNAALSTGKWTTRICKTTDKPMAAHKRIVELACEFHPGRHGCRTQLIGAISNAPLRHLCRGEAALGIDAELFRHGPNIG